MNSKDRADFLKQPRLDIGNRHKKKRLSIVTRWTQTHEHEAIEPLMSVIKNQQDDSDVRFTSVQALGFIPDAQSISALGIILSDQILGDFHSAAITALGEIGNKQAMQTLIESWEQLSGTKQNNIQKVLIQLESAKTIELLIESLGHSSLAVREQTTATLRQFENATPHLILALGHENDRVRDGVQSHLTQIGKPVIPSLAAVLGQSDEHIRQGAIKTLLQIGSPAIGELITLAISEDESTATIATDILIEIGEPSVKPLITASVSHPQTSIILLKMKESTIQVLKNASVDDVTLLIAVLGFADKDVCQTASEKLVIIGEPAIPNLLELLAGNDEQTQTAYDILAEMGDKAILPLVESLDDIRIKTKSEKLLMNIGEAVLLPLYYKLNDPESIAPDSIIELMCAVNGSDRLAVTISLYHIQIPVLSNIFGATILQKFFSGNATHKDKMHQTDIGEESIQGLYDMDGKMVELDPIHAISQLQTLTTIAPEFALPHYWLGQWYLLKLQDIEKAIHAFDLATQSQEYLFEHRQAKSYCWLAVCYAEPSPYYDYEKSLDYFQKTIELGWDEPLVYEAIQTTAQDASIQCLNDGKNPDMFLQVVRRKEEALRALAERLPDKDEDEITQVLQDAQYVLEQTEQAYEQLGKTAGFAKIRSGFFIPNAIDMCKDGQYQNAVDLLHHLQQDQPDDMDINIALGEVFLKCGQVHQGIKKLQQYLVPASSKTLVRIHNIIEDSIDRLDSTIEGLIIQKNYVDAMALLEDWKTLVMPTLPVIEESARDAFGHLLSRLTVRYIKVAVDGNPWILQAYGKGIQCIEIAFSLSPTQKIKENLAIVHEQMGRYYTSQGDFRNALAHFARSVEVTPNRDAHVWWMMSNIYRELNEMENGLTCLQYAAKLGYPEAIALIRTFSR